MVYPSQEVASTRVRWLVCGLPSPLRQERLLLMLQGYFDDSGSDAARPFFVLGGYILPAELWENFSDEWQTELQKDPRIEYFKMSEANAGVEQFAFSSEFRQYKVRKLFSLIQSHMLKGIETWLSWDEFNEFNAGLVGPAKDQAYAPLFFGIMDNVVEWQQQRGIFPSKIQLDFDQQGRAGKVAIASYGQMIEHCESNRIEADWRKVVEGTPRMLDDKKYPGLQAADMLAWCVRFRLENKDWADSEWGWLCDDIWKTVWPGCRRWGKESWEHVKEVLLARGPVTPPPA